MYDQSFLVVVLVAVTVVMVMVMVMDDDRTSSGDQSHARSGEGGSTRV